MTTGAGAGAKSGVGPAATNGAGAAATNGAGANGVAIAWLIVCELYDDAYGKIPPNAVDTNIAKATKIWNKFVNSLMTETNR